VQSPCRIALTADTLDVSYGEPGIGIADRSLFVAIETGAPGGSATMPYGHGTEGSTVFLPFRAGRLVSVRLAPAAPRITVRDRVDLQWAPPAAAAPEWTAAVTAGEVRLKIPVAGLPPVFRIAIWCKDLASNNGWGWMLGDPALGIRPGTDDKCVGRSFSVEPATGRVDTVPRRGPGVPRPRIYQLFVRLFGNTCDRRTPNGSLAENGVGRFDDINAAALAALADTGCTHVWLTGVLAQASATPHPRAGIPADDPDLLKGLAGSPYAIRDYFDVCPDYATDPVRRLDEFRALIDRVHAHGMKAIIDFVPNHVARSYRSTIRPELSFGVDDDRTRFFDPDNNFFWLQPDSPGGGAPLRLPTVDEHGQHVSPTCRVLGAGDGLFAEETDCGRVTGNNAATWRPGPNDWYETVKLNYGYDFTTGRRAYPHSGDPHLPIPDTWHRMDAVIAYWQEIGVDGFRCDMAHMVPPEFWAWALDRARARRSDVFFAGEAYDNDPMKVGTGNVMIDLLDAGFDAVYDDPAYKTLKGLYEAGRWANDLDQVLAPAEREFVFHNSLRYAENHDEVRLAGKGQWGDVGPAVGPPVSAILWGVARGPALLYNGQETGERADGVEGFGGDDARTTIFDYWSMPALVPWVNGHRYDGGRLDERQRALRAQYRDMLRLLGEPAFRDGEFYALNPANVDNPAFGRLDGESASGHWLYAFLRSDPHGGQRFLVAVNLHRSATLGTVQVHLPAHALDFVGLAGAPTVRIEQRLGADAPVRRSWSAPAGHIDVGDIPPLTAVFLELFAA
jgi:glycosidase